jgi:hypothetical protein
LAPFLRQVDLKTEIDNDLENIADFLTNSFENCSFDEMEEFLTKEFKLSPTQAKDVVEKYYKRFGTVPIVMEDEAVNFLKGLL